MKKLFERIDVANRQATRESVRAAFALVILHAMRSGDRSHGGSVAKTLAEEAVRQADELIEALNK